MRGYIHVVQIVNWLFSLSGTVFIYLWLFNDYDMVYLVASGVALLLCIIGCSVAAVLTCM